MSGKRRLSTSSSSSSGSSNSSLHPSGLDSSAALILIPDTEAEESFQNTRPFELSSDDEGDHSDEELFTTLLELRRASIPLTPEGVFLHLLTPFLKLGAIFLPNIGPGLQKRYSIIALVFFAVLSAFTRQIWYMLARYCRKTEIEEVFVEVFARGRDKERVRVIMRSSIKFLTGALRVLLAMAYIRESVDVLIPLGTEYLPEVLTPRLTITILAVLLVFPLSLVPTLASKRVVLATWGSIASYILWFSFVIYAHVKGVLEVNPGWLRMGTLWQGITTIAFAFTVSSTLPLYASLKGTSHALTPKSPRSRSFRTLSLLSVVVAVGLTLPLVFFYPSPAIPPTLEDEINFSPQPFISAFNALTLILGVPSVLITSPPIPIPPRIQNSTRIPLSKCMILLLVLALALVPDQLSAILSDVLLVMALSSTYFVPAFVHIVAHQFRRPISIIVPPQTPLPGSSHNNNPNSNAPQSPPASSIHDELLQRKEKALQRRQLRKRIIWDVGVWVLLVPMGGGGFIWAGGKVARRW